MAMEDRTVQIFKYHAYEPGHKHRVHSHFRTKPISDNHLLTIVKARAKMSCQEKIENTVEMAMSWPSALLKVRQMERKTFEDQKQADTNAKRLEQKKKKRKEA